MDTVVGDLDGNRARIVERLAESREAGAELVLFPELAVTGYPPEDLLLRPGFLRAAAESLDDASPVDVEIADNGVHLGERYSHGRILPVCV